MSRSAKIALFLLLGTPFVLAEQVQKLHHGGGAINDFAGVLGEEDKRQLETISDSVWVKHHAKIAIVTINSLEGEPVETFATDLFKQWGIGGKDDRGVLILLAIKDRQYRVEVGYGLEPILPDGKVGGFGREIVPAFKQKHYSNALVTLTTLIAQTIQSDSQAIANNSPPPLPQKPVDDKSHTGLGVYVVLVFFCLFCLMYLLSFLRWLLIACGYKNQNVLDWLPRPAGGGSGRSDVSSSSSSSSSSSDSGYDGGSSGGGGASGSF